MSQSFLSSATDQLRCHAEELVNRYGCVAFKMETESEGASIEEIGFYKQWIGNSAPLLVKIGGPNARNDLRQLTPLHVRNFVAPLVESSYAVYEFAQAVREVVQEECFTAINVETITAVKQLREILDTAKFVGIQQITLGRSDLSASISKLPEDEEVLELCIAARNQAKQDGFLIALGGAITPMSEVAITRVQPDKFETRNVVFSMSSCPNIVQAIEQALKFEITLLELFADRGFRLRTAVAKRIESLTSKIRSF